MKYNKVPSITESLKKVASSEARNMSALPAMRFMSGVVPSRRNTVNGNRKPNRDADKKSVGEIDWNNFAVSRGSYKNFDLISKKESYNVIVEPVEPSLLLLDLYPNAAAAYSLRKLRSDYTGPAIRVRETASGLHNEQDIYFVGNELDTASLLSFVGAGDGTISVWYDQSGSGNNILNGIASTQPTIVAGGTILTELGNATINFNNDVLNLSTTIDDDIYTSFAVSKRTQSGVAGISLSGALSGINPTTPLIFSDNNVYTNIDAPDASISAIFDNNNLNILTGYVDSNDTSAMAMFANGSELSTTLNLSLVIANTPLSRLGSYKSAASQIGSISELLYYPSDQSTNRAGIESNINSHYNIYAEDILEFNPYNIWDSEHITIDGTTTTVHDFNTFGDKYDMINPSASNQPTYNAASANFNGLPSFTFDGVSQYFKNDIVNYRNTDTTGVFVSVFRHLSGVYLFTLSMSDSVTTTRYFIDVINSGSYRAQLIPSAQSSFRGDTNIETGSPSSVVAYANTGTSYVMNINGSLETITMLIGANDGDDWLDTSSFDVISIGGLVRGNGILYSNIEWCMAGYFPYTDESTILNIVNFLKNKYGIV